jgi:co-chaperonin GroES (HSP10)
MIEPKYLKDFVELAPEIKELPTLKDNLILVEHLKFERKTSSGIIIPDGPNSMERHIMNDQPEWYVVLQVGEGYQHDENTTDDESLVGKKDPALLEVQVGNVCLIPRLAVRTFAQFGNIKNYVPNSIGIATSNSPQILFKDVESFNNYFDRIGK